MANLILEEETYKILGACFEVYREKGCGFLEPVYQESLEIEFEIRELTVVPLLPIPLTYKGRRLKKSYESDFVCFGAVILEIKAVSNLTDEHRAQIQNYLKATGLKVGILANFGHFPKLEYERYVN